MKLIVILLYGRSGSDLLQSLFDNHSEISQFPGTFLWPNFYRKIQNEKNLQRIAEIFTEDYKIFFDSRLNKMERHDQLGEKKDSFFLVDQEKFKSNFVNLFDGKDINKKNIFINLHLAYSLSCNEDIYKKKIIVLNLHLLELYTDLEDIEHEIILTIRNPIAALSSSAKHWLEYMSGKLTSPWQCYYLINRTFKIFQTLLEKKVILHVIKLESLHLESDKTLKNLSKIIGISFDQSLLNSSYHGKKWWGDALSKKYLDGLNPNFKNNIDFSFFYKKDLILINYYLYDIFKNFNYLEKEKREISRNFALAPLVKLLPLKIELLFLKIQLKNFNIKNIILFFYYWFKRVIIMRKNTNNLNLPKDVTSL
tara:strand:- start:1200 stop:2297 length:1098 start_codon:yes stop_codon:yes gene_type:complete